jgi:hypothetical protein
MQGGAVSYALDLGVKVIHIAISGFGTSKNLSTCHKSIIARFLAAFFQKPIRSLRTESS